MPETFVRTSVIEAHRFQTTDFWAPVCTRCHEKKRHPVHHGNDAEVCGYDPCEYCAAVEDPDRGVSLRGE